MIMLDGEIFVSKIFLFARVVNILYTMKHGAVSRVLVDVRNVYSLKRVLFAEHALRDTTDLK
jgi:hypothetical protein